MVLRYLASRSAGEIGGADDKRQCPHYGRFVESYLFDAEGATASETLRHQGPRRPATLWKAVRHRPIARLTEGSN